MVLTVVDTDTNDAKDPKFVCRINHILKGPPHLGDLTIRFHVKDALPKIGSRWFAFIDESVPNKGAFELTEGNDGLIAVNDQNQALMRGYYPDVDFLADGLEDRLRTLIERCESVFVTEANGEDKSKPRDRVFNFRIVEIVKGPPISKQLPIRYGAGEKAPEKGTRWMIFIQDAVPKTGAFETIDNEAGRIQATEKNLESLYRVYSPHAYYYGPNRK